MSVFSIFLLLKPGQDSLWPMNYGRSDTICGLHLSLFNWSHFSHTLLATLSSYCENTISEEKSCAAPLSIGSSPWVEMVERTFWISPVPRQLRHSNHVSLPSQDLRFNLRIERSHILNLIESISITKQFLFYAKRFSVVCYTIIKWHNTIVKTISELYLNGYNLYNFFAFGFLLPTWHI